MLFSKKGGNQMWEIRSRGGNSWTLVTPDGYVDGDFQELVERRKQEFINRGIELSSFLTHSVPKASNGSVVSCEFCSRPAVYYGNSKVGLKHLCEFHKRLYV